jgi:nucleotide-binding universal stress UspA family protein
VALVETIVVAYDDPESGTLSRAAELAEAFGASLVVTNVVPPEHDEEAEAERYGRERLEQARTFLESRGVTAEVVRSVGQPADAIIALARERDADLIVVGMRKKGFIERLVEGSVAQNVLRRAPCDVIVVH